MSYKIIVFGSKLAPTTYRTRTDLLVPAVSGQISELPTMPCAGLRGFPAVYKEQTAESGGAESRDGCVRPFLDRG